jgi:AcrR family transcriptional regulator
VLGAVIQTVREGGAHALTLDAVARQAQVSKGGLLHHFPAKDALIAALLDDLFARFDALAAHYYAREPDTPGRWLRAYVRATFDDEPLPLDVVLALVSALAEQPEVIDRVRDSAHLWHDRFVAEGIAPARAQIIRAAADGYWTDVMLGLAPQTPDERRALMDDLLRLIDCG